MKNSSPNDVTAKYYDITSSHFKGESLSIEELNLTKRYCKIHGKILDIGCGTGRHLVSLAKIGYIVTGIDLSKGMLDVLKEKNIINATIINADILKYQFPRNEKFDLIIMFWNTFNEICLTKANAIKLLNKCKNLLNFEGEIIINSDNIQNINPQLFDYSTEDSIDGRKVTYHWQIHKYLKRTRTSISRETVSLDDTQVFKTLITQRWWSEEEYIKIAKKTGFLVKKLRISRNDEHYFLLTKIR